MSKLYNALRQSESIISLDDQSLSIKRICLRPDVLPNLQEQTVVVYTGKDSFLCVKLFIECLQKKYLFFPLSNLDAQTLCELQNYLPVLVVSSSTQISLHKKLSFESNNEIELSSEGGLIVQTSGTTSNIKKYAIISESMILENAENFHAKVESENCFAICFASFEHTSGFNALLIPSLMKSIDVKLIQNFPAFKVSVNVANSKKPLIHLTPMQFSILMQTNFLNTINEKQGVIIVGSSEIRSKTINLLKNKSFKSYVNYGLTEAGPYLLTTNITNNVNMGFDLNKDKPEKTKIRMVPIDNNLSLFKLSLSGPNLFNGYLNFYKFNREVDWLETNDVFAKIDERYIFFSRESDLIYENKKYYSAPLIEDDIINNIPQVEDCLVRKLSIGYSIYMQSNKNIKKDFVLKYVNQNHPYLGEKLEVCFVKKIPRTASGKIVRK